MLRNVRGDLPVPHYQEEPVVATYLVPCYGPSIQMTPERDAWAKRIGATVQHQEFNDLDAAKRFAARISSKVLDAKKKLLFDPSAPEPAAEE